MSYNKLLQRQLKKHYGDVDTLPPELLPVLKVISDSYDHYDKDRRLLERSIELSSNEMIELNKILRDEKEELRGALHDLKLLFENVNEHLYSMDMVNHRITKMADVCEKIYGYPAADFFADPDLWRKVIHPDDQQVVAGGHGQLAQGKAVFNQHRIIHRDGSIRWLDNKVLPTLDASGRLVRIDGVTTDITERMNAEISRTKLVSLLEATLESTADGILVAGIGGEIISYNKKFLELWRIPCEIVREQNDKKAIAFVLDQLVEPDRFLTGVQALYSQPHEVSFDLLKFKDGRIFERYSQPQLVNGEVVGRVWSFRDISERVRAEQTLRESEAALEAKNRELEAKNKELEQFAYVASHDLQEPLRTSISFIELLRKQYHEKLDDTADRYFEFILGASERMKVLIKDLLDYSRIGRKTVRADVDCSAAVKEVLSDLGTAITESGAKICTDKLPMISGYPTEIKQLFLNLVVNAIKFHKPGQAPNIHISVKSKGAFWQFAVSDNGIGLEAEHRERIFVIFQRLHTRSEYEGSGIGLAHCKKIVGLHGGEIWVDSIPGEGSTFYFTLPKNTVQ